jgi:hypothetical protein
MVHRLAAATAVRWLFLGRPYHGTLAGAVKQAVSGL